MNQPAEFQSQSKLEDFHRKHRAAMLTMLFSDIVGSTRLKSDLGDVRAVETIEKHHEIVRSLLTQFPEAEEIGTAGDSFFVVFVRPSDAVHFALMLQSALRLFSQEIGVRVANRIGIHVGEIFVQEDSERGREFFGIQVDTSARIMALGGADQILLSRFAYDNARQALRGRTIEGVGELSWMNHGSYELKGVEEPIEVCEVGETGFSVLKAPVRTDASDTFTLITRDGKKFRATKVTAIDTGLSVVGPDGGALIPFNQLPDDLSIFPEKTRDEISKAKKVQVFKLGKAQKSVASKGPMMSLFEATLTGNYTKQQIEARKWSNLEKEAFVPSFTDELPPAAVSLGGVDVLQTIHFINRKIKDGDRIIYYDNKLKAFVCGCPAFCPNGRVRILYADCRSFDPADLNPDQIEKITHDDGTVSIGVYTTNRADAITCHENNGFNYKTHTFVVPVADDGEARMMCKAIIRFIRAYGGR